MLTRLRILGAALALLVGLAAEAGTISGTVRVIDADTLDVGATRVRLFGIDSPEVDQTCGDRAGGTWKCGAWARDQARALFQGSPAVCADLGPDRYGRRVARCTIGAEDAADRLVRDGVALAYMKYSSAYADAEKSARVAGLGIWRGPMQDPAAWRAARAGTPASATPAPDGCAIKGNISKSGAIYHLPGQADYGRTRISPEKGERWFCSEPEAIAAGWRRARR